MGPPSPPIVKLKGGKCIKTMFYVILYLPSFFYLKKIERTQTDTKDRHDSIKICIQEKCSINIWIHIDQIGIFLIHIQQDMNADSVWII